MCEYIEYVMIDFLISNFEYYFLFQKFADRKQPINLRDLIHLLYSHFCRSEFYKLNFLILLY